MSFISKEIPQYYGWGGKRFLRLGWYEVATVGSEYVNKIKKSMGKKEKGGGEDGTSGRDT